MRLDRYDLGATAAVAATGAIYWAHASDVGVVSGGRVAAAMMVVTGLAGCVTDGSRPGNPTTGWYAGLASAFGMLALAVGVGAVIFAKEALVVAVLAITVAMWVVTTAAHLLRRPPVMRPVEVEEEHRELAGVR